MSDDALDPQRPSPRWLKPAWFLAGLALGLGALAWLGRSAGRVDYHPEFKRFIPAISPETSYYPTLNEMIAIVRARCRPDQVLVIVGGNSILEGVWQPVSDLWSDRLQKLLGDRYCVINFAFRGSAPTDGGAIVAETLRNEFQRQIYIANEAPLTAVDSIGHDQYQYLFWEAYFRGALLDAPGRAARVREFRRDPGHRREWVDAAISCFFDRALHFRDFWNRLCFEDFCTVPSYLGESYPDLLTPRCRYSDSEEDATDAAFRIQRYPASVLDAEMRIVRASTVGHYGRGPDGDWRLQPSVGRYKRGPGGELRYEPSFQESLASNLSAAFPAPLKPRTLILIGRNSPHYRRRLEPGELALEDRGFRDAVQFWSKAGCSAVEYGRDFTDDDFGDRIHLSKLGGAKLADAVAPEVRGLAEKLGYFK